MRKGVDNIDVQKIILDMTPNVGKGEVKDVGLALTIMVDVHVGVAIS